MIGYIIGTVGAFLVGMVVGGYGYYRYMDSVYQRYPYQFRTIINEVIKKRIAEGKLQPLEQEKVEVKV